MAKFIAHGLIMEEPSTRVVGAKLTKITTVRIEERQIIGGKEVVNNLAIDFVGKTADLIPADRKIAGMVCVVWGNVSSREWNGRSFYDLKGDQFTLAEPRQERYVVAPKDEVQETKSGNLDQLDVADDDLPF